jgi:hypothetical protein
MNKLTPKNFAKIFPYGSVLSNTECEMLAVRILRYSQSWDNLITWEEYKKILSPNDITFINVIKRDFERVIPYLKSPEKAATFSPEWKNHYLRQI